MAPGPTRGQQLCGPCAREPAPWLGIGYHGLYRGPLRDMILRLKFNGQLPLARVLGTFLLNASACLPAPDGIVPVPQVARRLRQRGYNQAHELARELAQQSGLPFRPQLLLRKHSVAPQEGLGAQERRLNLQGAFLGAREAAGLTVWVVDDVFTSGSTARAATAALLDSGARRVCLLFVARTDYN